MAFSVDDIVIVELEMVGKIIVGTMMMMINDFDRLYMIVFRLSIALVALISNKHVDFNTSSSMWTLRLLAGNLKLH